jgi:hypothetical protein
METAQCRAVRALRCPPLCLTSSSSALHARCMDSACRIAGDKPSSHPDSGPRSLSKPVPFESLFRDPLIPLIPLNIDDDVFSLFSPLTSMEFIYSKS